MPKITEAALLSFREELQKLSAVPWQALGKNVGSLMGAGTAVGAVGGGLYAGGKKYLQAREEGSDVLHAGAGAFGASVGGAAKGALTGAAVGGLAGAAGTHLKPELTGSIASKLTNAPGGLGAFSRFGQRQVHGLTGWTPEEGLDSIRGGAWGERNRLKMTGDALQDAKARGVPEGEFQKLTKNHQKATVGKDIAQEIEDRGMTSLPGVAKALMGKDRIGALKATAKHQWTNANGAEKALMVGLPALSAAGSLVGPEDPEHGRAEQLGKNLVPLIGGIPLGGVAALPMMAASQGLMGAGAMAGRGIDKLRRRGAVPGKPEHTTYGNEQHVHTERVLSPAAAGEVPEGIQ